MRINKNCCFICLYSFDRTRVKFSHPCLFLIYPPTGTRVIMGVCIISNVTDILTSYFATHH